MPRPHNPLFNKSLVNMPESELWTHYEACLKAHDWQHHYSDDFSVWSMGQDERVYIEKMNRTMRGLDIERAKNLYGKYRQS